MIMMVILAIAEGSFSRARRKSFQKRVHHRRLNAPRRQQGERHGEDQVDHQHEHAELPLLVTNAPVRTAMSIIATAPGQNCRSIGVGPMM